MNTQYTKEFGRQGEDIAIAYLIEHNHKIIARNVFLRWAEIDVVTQKGDTLYFVEVKYRSSVQYGAPQESVSVKKRRKIEIAGQYYANKRKDLTWTRLKFAVLAITKTAKSGQPKMNWLVHHGS